MAFNSDIDGNIKATNVAGVDSVIWKYVVPDSSVVEFPIKQPIEMKLYKSDGSEISDTSLVWFAVKVPYKTVPVQLTKPLLYRKFKNLTPAEQADINTLIFTEVDDAFKGSDMVRIKQKRVVYVYVNSPDQVDWSQGSYFNLEQTELKGAE